MNVTTVDTNRFFSSLDQYKVLKEKAAFALKAALWEKLRWSDGDLDILREIASLNATNETFQTEIESKILKLERAKVHLVVSRLMGHQKNPPPPRPPRPFPIPQIRSTFKDREIGLGSPPLPRAKSAFQRPEEMGGASVKHPSSSSYFEAEVDDPPNSENLSGGGINRSPSQRASEPAIKYKADEKEPPKKKWPDFRKAKTMAHFPGVDDFYPSCLIIPELRMRLIEGAVSMKFLFVGSYQKLFKSKLERTIFDLLFDLYLMMTHKRCPIKEALEVCFKKLLTQKKGVVEAVLYNLSKDQTLSQIAKGSPAVLPELAPCFKEAPFNDTASAKAFIRLLAHVKYRCTAVFGHLSSDEKRVADLVLNASLMMDFLQFPFPKAMGFVLAQSPKFKEASVGTLVRSISLAEMVQEEPKKLSILDYEEGLKNIFCLQHEALFDYFVFYMGTCIPRIEDHETRLVGQVVKAIDSRRKEEPFQEAWKKSFNPEGMQRILQGNDEDNLIRLRQCLINLSPGEFVSHLPNAHPSLKREEAFHDLLNRAQGFETTHEMEVDFRRTVSYLVRIKTEIEKKGLSWKQAIWLFLNHEALRELLDSENDLENANEFNSYLHLIK